MRKLITIVLLLTFAVAATGAYNSYTNHFYIVVKKGEAVPESLKPVIVLDQEGKPTGERKLRAPGEGVNNGTLSDGRIWFADAMLGKEDFGEWEALVDAKRAGLVQVKTSAQFRVLKKQLAAAIRP